MCNIFIVFSFLWSCSILFYLATHGQAIKLRRGVVLMNVVLFRTALSQEGIQRQWGGGEEDPTPQHGIFRRHFYVILYKYINTISNTITITLPYIYHYYKTFPKVLMCTNTNSKTLHEYIQIRYIYINKYIIYNINNFIKMKQCGLVKTK